MRLPSKIKSSIARRRSPRAVCATVLAATLLSVAASPAWADVGPDTRYRHPHAAYPGETLGEMALQFALGQMGKPYEYGGNGPHSYDCSGLTQQAWRSAGVRIPRTSQQQAYSGAEVSLSRIRLGDLVVFYSDASHVGIYAGHGKVVVAPHEGAYIRLESIAWMPVYDVRRPG